MNYFFDCSALLKRYHRETGTDVVDAIVGAPDNTILISALTPVEVRTAFAIKARTGQILEAAAMGCIRRFQVDVFTRGIEVVPFTLEHIRRAEWLAQQCAFTLRLRAGDALQLGVALELQAQNLVHCFVAADRVLCEVAAREGFTVVDPERPTLAP